jgi:hypothetical protein
MDKQKAGPSDAQKQASGCRGTFYSVCVQCYFDILTTQLKRRFTSMNEIATLFL